jgi:hypothetical protein
MKRTDQGRCRPGRERIARRVKFSNDIREVEISYSSKKESSFRVGRVVVEGV